MTNNNIGYDEVFDNQNEASKICGIPQARISRLIKDDGEQDGWCFEYLGEIEYKDSSGFKKMLDMQDVVTVRNINTGEEMTFDCKQYMCNYFGLTGNDTSSYFNKGYIIMHEWEVVNKN